ncbi:MAG TPA: ankyrin repeat domain-containing protein [Bacillota bacterium]|nr:ankyrin repeat domain-containing protein [Bacillota bacterium]HOL10743.1 ankyrin repeat domain-containing protein [Bacillota bacterium]HPO97224.1 ankyrin repeat domain-containing protein [Bacillota bacterium]
MKGIATKIGLNLLEWNVIFNFINLFEELSGVDIGVTDLHVACSKKDTELEEVKRLLETEECIDAIHAPKRTALHLATINGRDDIVQCLIEKEADINFQDVYEYTPLHYACRKGYTKIVKILIDAGAEMNITTEEDETPLSLARENEFPDIVDLLIKNGAEE